MFLEKAKRGRPIATKTLITQKVRERIAQKIAEHLDPMIDAQIQLATKQANTNAFRFLLEHSIGKPKETIEHQGQMGIVSLVARLEKEGRTDSMTE